MFGEGLYPVPLKQDELGHECRPEALYPIYAAVLAPDGNREEAAGTMGPCVARWLKVEE